MIDFKAKPFNLNDADIKWVNDTYESLSHEERVNQLFCMIGMMPDEGYLTNLAKNYAPGGIMFRAMDKQSVYNAHKILQDNSKVPMLLAANLEAGGSGLVSDGTTIGTPMGIAATGNVQNAVNFGKNVVKEASAVGGNWAFAPIVDIDYEWRNPITNTRTFGSDVDTIIEFADAYNQELLANDIAVSIKHFPGDGVDERDQHLVTSINSLDAPTYEKTYGRIYKELIERGANTVMAGHIYQPAIERKFNPELTDEQLMPGSLSPYLLNSYLREELGFNGLIVTDATLMVGMVVMYPRHELPARAIAAGCDMFLFTKNVDEDIQYMLDGIESGILSQERLKEAVLRILALKASMKLHIKQANNSLLPDISALDEIGTQASLEAAKKVADEAITLVKNKENVIPINRDQVKNILVLEQSNVSMMGPSQNVGKVAEKLADEGFNVDKLDTSSTDMAEIMKNMVTPVSAYKEKYDLILYVVDYQNASNNTVQRISYSPTAMFADMPIYVKDIPTMMVSLSNPYHLFDVPFMKTYINTYTNSDITIDALIEKMLGKSEFKGKSPVDPFCGKWDTRL